MQFSWRGFIIDCSALFAFCPPEQAASRFLHGGTPPAIQRVLIIGYGQSNMDQFFQVGTGSAPAASAGTSFYGCDGSNVCSLQSVPNADGIRILQNTIKTVTGLPSLSMVCAIGGSALNGLISGGPSAGQTGYQGCINQALANILPTDQVFFLWDQGETDSAAAEAPDAYGRTVATLHANLAAAIGRTTTTAPWIIAGKGVVNCPGCVGSGWMGSLATPLSWHVLTNSLKEITYYDTGARWFTEYDYQLGSDGLHYTGFGTALGGARFARHITNFMGYTSGPPTFEIASASVIDATNTAVNVTQNLGTDYTPASSASGTNGWEISGDNGATWGLVSTTHTSATQIKLTHASLPANNSRLVRYLYGPIPPNTVYPCASNPCVGPTNLTFDNSSLTIPLSPTTWDVRASSATTLPMATWRDVVALNGNGGQVQAATGIPLGPEQVRKYLVISLAGPSLAVTNLTITPKDYLGNAVGTAISLTNPSPLATAGTTPTMSIYGTLLNANNANAAVFDLSFTFVGSPFQGSIIHAWTIPSADLTSTTPTGTNGSVTATSTTGTTTLTASVGGVVIAAATSSVNQGAGAYSFSASDSGATTIPMGTRWVTGSGIPDMAADGANIQAAGTASVTANFLASGTVNMAAVAFR